MRLKKSPIVIESGSLCAVAALWFAASIALTTVVLADAAAADAVNPYANSTEAAGKGEELFGRRCQQCHNSHGKGGKGPQLIRGAWGPGAANTDLMMYQVISGGRPGTAMGSFASTLTSEEIWQIITFLRAEAKRVKADEAKAADDDIVW